MNSFQVCIYIYISYICIEFLVSFYLSEGRASVPPRLTDWLADVASLIFAPISSQQRNILPTSCWEVTSQPPIQILSVSLVLSQ